MKKSTERFSDRVNNYVKYRPSYPQAVIDTIKAECGLKPNATIADIGSGTGIFSQLLLESGFEVYGVEPNDNMRKAAENQLSNYTGFSSINGQSENTNLPSSSIDLITAAQAFHWFNGKPSRREFSRILKTDGYIALVWNQRNTEQIFQQEYDEILRCYATDYSLVNHARVTDETIKQFCLPAKVATFRFNYSQQFDLTGFLGRMLSASYTPKEKTTGREILIAAAKDIFAKHEHNGCINFDYDTRLYIAQLGA